MTLKTIIICLLIVNTVNKEAFANVLIENDYIYSNKLNTDQLYLNFTTELTVEYFRGKPAGQNKTEKWYIFLSCGDGECIRIQNQFSDNKLVLNSFNNMSNRCKIENKPNYLIISCQKDEEYRFYKESTILIYEMKGDGWKQHFKIKFKPL